MKAYKDDFDNIEVPITQVDMMVQRAINEGERHAKNKKRISIGALVVVLGICFLSSGFVSTSMARVFVNIPFVGSIFESFADKELENISSDDLTKLDNMQITDHGITIAIKEVYYDQSSISIAYLVSGADYSTEKSFMAHFYYNGHCISGTGSWDCKQISDKLYSELHVFHPGSESTLPEKFNLEVVLTDDWGKEQQRESPYRFIIPVSRSHAAEKTKDVVLMRTVRSGDCTLLLKKIVFTPVSTIIEYDYTHPDNDGNHEIKLLNGNGVELSEGSRSYHVEKSKDQYTNIGRAYFSASNPTSGDWTFELVPVRGDNIKVNFYIEQ